MAFAALTGCSDTNEPPPPAVTGLVSLASPAEEGTGEPFLSTGEDGVLMSWLAEENEGAWSLKVARLDGEEWSAPSTVATGRDFFVNWADFPSVREVDGTLLAHWLERGPERGYDYGVRIVRSTDGGSTWSEPWTPHEDGTHTEHGFASIFSTGSGAGIVWLDGRAYAEGGHGSPTDEMGLRFRGIPVGDEEVGWPDPVAAGPETLLDGRTCDCCQTDAAMTAHGPLVVYRDRSDDEIRDIYVVRRVDGVWTEPAPVHEDGWHIEACPVNGPAVDALGDQVAVAWFTAPGDSARVRAAFSSDGGATFGAPVAIDDGNPGGRVDLILLADGSALVSWLERSGGEAADIRVRRIWPDGRRSTHTSVTTSSAARSSGFPRMAAAPDGRIIFAWTDLGGDEPTVLVAAADVPDGSPARETP